MKKRYTVVAALLAGLLALSSVAHAAEEVDRAAATTTVDRAGTLAARGIGHVGIEGKGWVRLAMHGRVTITIGPNTSVKIRAIGQDTETVTDATTISLHDFTGVIVVRGADFRISATGVFRRIDAAGHGTAFLKGRGRYRASGGQSGTWTKDGVTVEYGS